MLAVTLIAMIFVVVLFATAIIISISGNMRANRMELRRLRAKLDRHIEQAMPPVERKALDRRRTGNAEYKRQLFEHGV